MGGKNPTIRASRHDYPGTHSSPVRRPSQVGKAGKDEQDLQNVVNLFRLPFRETKNRASDDALVRAAQGGDRKAFDSLFQMYHLELRRFMARRIPEGDVEDVLQETWLAAWTALPGYDRRSKFKTWLYALSLNKCRDHHRTKKRTEPMPEDFLEGALDSTDIQKQTENKQTAAAVLEAVSPTQREVLELYYFAELTLPEIATTLNRNLNTVKYQFYRGHVQAGEFLQRQGRAPMNQGASICR